MKKFSQLTEEYMQLDPSLQEKWDVLFNLLQKLETAKVVVNELMDSIISVPEEWKGLSIEQYGQELANEIDSFLEDWQI